MIKTPKDIIKILPFEDQFKHDLLTKYDSLDEDQRYNIDSILWDAYDALYSLKLDENLLLAFERARNNQEELDNGLYGRVREQTEKEMQTEEVTVSTDVDLSQARNKLQDIISAQQGVGTN